MRWQELFADLEGQARAWERGDLDAEIADRTRGEWAQVLLVNRLRAAVGSLVTVDVVGAGRLAGELETVGADWLLLTGSHDDVVALAAIVAIHDLAPGAVSPDGVGPVSAGLRLTAALRAVAMDRSAVTVRTRDGGVYTGTPDHVGSNFLELAVHEAGEVPRAGVIRSRCVLSLDAVASVRRLAAPWAE